MSVLFFLLGLFISSNAFSYSNFIGHGYTSCLNCHYNPLGGGPINDYGRAIAATAISSNALYPKSWNEEKIAYTSGFLFRKPKQNWFRTQINYRGFQLVRNPGSSEAEQKKWINMQADGRLILKTNDDRLIAVGSYGYAPLPTPPPPGKEQSEWRSREHYIGYRINPKMGVYAGLMDQSFGVRVIEHIAYSRTLPQVTQNDQVHGLMFHFLNDSFEGSVHGFVGNLYQDEDLQTKGGSFMLEKTIFGKHRLGGSAKKTKNEYTDLTAYAVHGRFDLHKGSALLTEIGQVKKVTENGTGDRSSRYGLLQTYLRPFRGLYFLANVEYLQADIKEKDYVVRWGPGIQYFPIQRVELRFDVYNTRNFDPNSASPDVWMYLFQGHLWL
jgi:hypothetical protein